MYKSPIEITHLTGCMDSIAQDIMHQTDECIYKAVVNVGVSVDRDELIRALQYDRGQYEKGYMDGKAAAMASIVQCHECWFGKQDKAARFHDVHGNENDTSLYVCCRGEGCHHGTHYCAYGERRDDHG